MQGGRRRFPAAELERERLQRGILRIEYTDYDWTLNSQQNDRSDD
jgi:hypothetical protein